MLNRELYLTTSVVLIVVLKLYSHICMYLAARQSTISSMYSPPTYPILILSDVSSLLNKAFHSVVTAFSCCQMQGSPLSGRNNDSSCNIMQQTSL